LAFILSKLDYCKSASRY